MIYFLKDALAHCSGLEYILSVGLTNNLTLKALIWSIILVLEHLVLLVIVVFNFNIKIIYLQYKDS